MRNYLKNHFQRLKVAITFFLLIIGKQSVQLQLLLAIVLEDPQKEHLFEVYEEPQVHFSKRQTAQQLFFHTSSPLYEAFYEKRQLHDQNKYFYINEDVLIHKLFA